MYKKSIFFLMLCFYLPLYAVTITGSVYDNDFMPVAGVTVVGNKGLGIAYTNSEGLYTFRVSRQDTYTISALPKGSLIPSKISKKVAVRDIVSGEEEFTVDFSFKPNYKKAFVFGFVFNAGKPLSKVRVRLTGVSSIKTDENGIFAFNVKKGKYFLTPIRDGYSFSQPLYSLQLGAGDIVRANFNAVKKPMMADYNTYFSGAYKLTLSVAQNECPGFRFPSLKEAIVTQRGANLSFLIPKFALHSGKSARRAYSVKGTFSKDRCIHKSSITVSHSAEDRATVNGSLNISCPKVKACNVIYSGVMERK